MVGPALEALGEIRLSLLCHSCSQPPDLLAANISEPTIEHHRTMMNYAHFYAMIIRQVILTINHAIPLPKIPTLGCRGGVFLSLRGPFLALPCFDASTVNFFDHNRHFQFTYLCSQMLKNAISIIAAQTLHVKCAGMWWLNASSIYNLLR